MIWNPQAMLASSEAVWQTHLLTEMDGLCADDPDLKRELAGAVAVFLGQPPAGVAQFTEYVALLVTRALWAVGREADARRWAARQNAVLNLAPGWAEAALASEMPLSEWRILLGTHTVRPATWAGLRQGAFWILDLRRGVAGQAAALELVVFRVVTAALDRMAAVWDRSRGRGLLGLRHVREVAVCLAGRSRKNRARLEGDLLTQCARKLAAAGKRRGWDAVPEVMSLDL